MQQVTGQVVQNRDLGHGLWHLIVEAPEIAAAARPGQFAMLRVGPRLEPLLRRPISFYRIVKYNGWVEFIYKLVGKGTEILTGKVPGDSIDLVGPLGQGWTLLPETKRIGVLGRGIGIAPQISLAEAARKRGIEVHAFFSAREPELIVGLELLEELGCKMYLHSDRGAYSGKVQVVTEYLEELLAREKLDQLYTCGSRRLGRFLLDCWLERGIKGQISLEERMACGLGACVGCVTEIVTDQATGKREYQRVCKEGPVFWVEEVGMLYDYC